MPDIELSMDGPHSPERTREVALLVAECIRYLNRATMPGQDGLEYPADAERVLGDIGTAVERLPQLLGQVREFLEDWQAAGTLLDADGGNPSTQVSVACGALLTAMEHAESLAGNLGHARNAISGLYVKDDDNA